MAPRVRIPHSPTVTLRVIACVVKLVPSLAVWFSAGLKVALDVKAGANHLGL